MAGISDKAIKTSYGENKYRYNSGDELQNKEFADGSGLEMYDAGFRTLDPQLGRFDQIDPLGEQVDFASTYQYANGNPIAMNDPGGLKAQKPPTSFLIPSINIRVPDMAVGNTMSSYYLEQPTDPTQQNPSANDNGGDDNISSSDGQGVTLKDILAATPDGGATILTSDGTGGFNLSVADQVSTSSTENGMWISYGYGLNDGSNGNLATDVFVNEFIASPTHTSGPTLTWTYDPNGLSNTTAATFRYYHGTGAPASLGNYVIKDLVNSNAFQMHNRNIISGRTPRMAGDFAVNLTWKDFFVGRTNVNYSIQVNGNSATVTFTLFVNDGFWDPNFVSEHAGSGKDDQPDGMGPNLEFPGGHPYPFIPVIATEKFTNPGYH